MTDKDWFYADIFGSRNDLFCLSNQIVSNEDLYNFRKLSGCQDLMEQLTIMILNQKEEYAKLKYMIYNSENVNYLHYKEKINQQIQILLDTTYSSLEKLKKIQNKNSRKSVQFEKIQRLESKSNKHFWIAKEIRNYMIHESNLFKSMSFTNKMIELKISAEDLFQSCNDKHRNKELELLSNQGKVFNQFDILGICKDYIISFLKILKFVMDDIEKEYSDTIKFSLELLDSDIALKFNSIATSFPLKYGTFQENTDIIFFKEDLIKMLNQYSYVEQQIQTAVNLNDLT